MADPAHQPTRRNPNSTRSGGPAEGPGGNPAPGGRPRSARPVFRGLRTAHRPQALTRHPAAGAQLGPRRRGSRRRRRDAGACRVWAAEESGARLSSPPPPLPGPCREAQASDLLTFLCESVSRLLQAPRSQQNSTPRSRGGLLAASPISLRRAPVSPPPPCPRWRLSPGVGGLTPHPPPPRPGKGPDPGPPLHPPGGGPPSDSDGGSPWMRVMRQPQRPSRAAAERAMPPPAWQLRRLGSGCGFRLRLRPQPEAVFASCRCVRRE